MTADADVIESRTVHFRVDGEGLTRLVRSRVLEGRWDWSWKLLMEDLHGMTAEIALSILRGDKKLVSDDKGTSVELEDDDDQRYKADFAYLYAGVYVTPDGRFLRPYAVVTSWGPEDMHVKDTSITPGSDSVYRRSPGSKDKTDYAYRSLFYADDRQRDVLRLVRLPADYVLDEGLPPSAEFSVLFKEVRGFPAVLAERAPLNDPQAAVEAYLAADLRLHEAGYSKTFPPAVYKIREETRECEAPTLSRTMSELRDPDDVDVLVEHQRGQLRKKRKKQASEIAKLLDEASRTVTDMDQPLAKRLKAWANVEKYQDEAFQADRLAGFRMAILEQAGDNLFDLKVKQTNGHEVTYKVPRAPFERWALNRTAWFHLGPEWTPICPQGLKMLGDDPFHSDWMVGAGIDPRDWNAFETDGLGKAAYDALHEVQDRYFHVEVPVLSGTGAVFDKIVHLKPGERSGGRGRIAVIQNAGPAYVHAAIEAIETDGALITEAGGSVAHLVTAFRDKNLRIIRVPNARKLYPAGRYATVDCDAGAIRLSEQNGPIRLANGTIIPVTDDSW